MVSYFDIEPVSLTSAGYRSDRGGWGFLYANLTQALINLYKQAAPEDTLMAVYAPAAGRDVAESSVRIAWEVIGKTPASFTILLDGSKAAEGIQDGEYTLDLAGVALGAHVLSVVAEGAVNHYPLARDRMDARLPDAVPVRVDIPFSINKNAL